MLLLLCYFLLLAWLSWKGYLKYIDSPIRLYYFPALCLKLAAGVVLGMLYFLYYDGGDTLNYHHDAAALADTALHNPLAYLEVMMGGGTDGIPLIYGAEERALLAAKIFSVLYLLTDSNYWITSCFLSFFSFLILFRLAHRLVIYRPDIQKPAVLAFLFWPSFVFWTSGMLKESLAIICIGFIISTTLPFLLAGKNINRLEAALSIIFLFMLFKLKYYYAGMLAPVLLSLLASLFFGIYFHLKNRLVWGLFILFMAGGALLATQLHPNLYVERFLGVWVENYYLLSNISAEGKYVLYENLQANWESVLQNSPKAVFAGLYAPLYPLDFTNPLRMAAAAENILLLLISLCGVAGWLLCKKGRLSLLAFALIIYVLVFALIMAIAAPNYGTLSRYQVSYQPFFVLLMLMGCQYLLNWLRLKGKKGLN